MTILRVGVSPWNYLHPECYQNPQLKCQAGVELDILHVIASMAGMTLKLVLTNESGCGKTPIESKTNNWTGLFKMVVDGDVDVTANLCDINKLAEFQQSIATSWPVWQYQEQYVIKAPKPAPLSFAPQAPFETNVWIVYAATFIIYVGFVMLYSYFRYSAPEKIFVRIAQAIFDLTDVCCGFTKHVPLQLIWPMWLLIYTSAFIFYNTYILSAVLHPFPIYKPFSDKNDLADSMLAGNYRLVSYKNPPAIPGGCLGQPCGDKFNQAIAKYGFELLPNAQGRDQLVAIDQQSPDAKLKMVLVYGEPFIKLYLSEYLEGRQNLWVIDPTGSFEKWSGFVWGKNFPHAALFNRYLRMIGDYKVQALARYIKPYGAQPFVGDQISEKIQSQRLAVQRFRGLFFMYVAGIAGSVILLFMEAGCMNGIFSLCWRPMKNVVVRLN